jgi:hypothetical protein
MLPRENQLCGCARPNATRGSVPAGLALACDFAFRFQCQMGSSLVLHRPIETTALTGQVKSDQNHMSGNATYQELPEKWISLVRLG